MRRIKRLIGILLMCMVMPAWSQRDLSFHTGRPWETIEKQRAAIEDTILSGNVGGGLVLSASHLINWKDTPAFMDIATSVYRGYGGMPLEEEQQLLTFLKEELEVKPNGLGWLECGLVAMAAMKPEEATRAFMLASKDSLCCQAPLTFALLGQALTYAGKIHEATRAFRDAVRASSSETALQFQMRHLYAETMYENGLIPEWQKAVEGACNSDYPLECAWGLQQEAQYAWRQKDRESFEFFTNLAVAQLSFYNEGTSWKWRWEKDRWDWLSRHVGYASAAIKGETDSQMVLDYECSILDANRGDLEAALRWIEAWPDRYNLEEIDQWNAERQLWVQRVYVAYYVYLARTGRAEEAVSGLERMLLFARDNYHEKFSTSLYCHLGYALTQANRLEDAKTAYELGLSLFEVPGEMIDPTLAYHPKGRIGKKARVTFVANYRNLLNSFNQREGVQ